MKHTIIKYLYDAGFKQESYVLDDKEIGYIEVFFTNFGAISYIIDDIKKTEYDEILEIKQYKYPNGNLSAIITYK